jgi:hypothetical protein
VKCSTFLFSFVFIIISFLLPPNTYAQLGTPDSDIPNAGTPSGMWTKTSEGTQIGIGLFELFIIGSSQLIREKEYQRLSSQYNKLGGIQVKTEKKYKDKANELQAEEAKLASLESEKKLAIETQVILKNTILEKTAAVEKAKRLLTTSARNTRQTVIMRRMGALSSKAYDNFAGDLEDHDGLINSLPEDEAKEFRRLWDEKRELQQMAPLDSNGVETLQRDAFDDLKATQKSQATNIENIRNIEKQIARQSDAVERLVPSVEEFKVALAGEESETRVAKDAMLKYLGDHKIPVYSRQALRWGGPALVCLDLGPRLFEWWVMSKDPGITPWGVVFVKLANAL